MSQPSSPDVLGVLTEERLTLQDVLQCAIGVFPTDTVLGQPVEVLMLLQSLIDQPLRLQLTILSPAHDAEGNLMNIFTPKPRLTLTLPAGETGLLHLPVIPELPTQPGDGYPVLVQVALQKPEQYTQIRPVVGGRPPSLMSISPFRIAVLRDIKFKAREQLSITFNVQDGRLPPRPEPLQPRYEALWTQRDFEQELAKLHEVSGAATRFANTLTRTTVYNPLQIHTKTVFAGAGMALLPGEITFITKLLTYVLDDGLELEQGFSLETSCWFQKLCALMIKTPDVIQSIEQTIKLLYTSVVQDAVLLGCRMLAQDMKLDFGDQQEQIGYANKIVSVLEGRQPMSLDYVYVPFVMAGLLLTARVALPGQNPWKAVASLKESRAERIKTAGESLHDVFEIVDELIESTERMLRDMRIPPE